MWLAIKPHKRTDRKPEMEEINAYQRGVIEGRQLTSDVVLTNRQLETIADAVHMLLQVRQTAHIEPQAEFVRGYVDGYRATQSSSEKKER
jgi:hypothetical protein